MKGLIICLFMLSGYSTFAALQTGKLEDIQNAVLSSVEKTYNVECPTFMSAGFWTPAIDKTVIFKAKCGPSVIVEAKLRLLLKGLRNFSISVIENADYELERVIVKSKK